MAVTNKELLEVAKTEALSKYLSILESVRKKLPKELYEESREYVKKLVEVTGGKYLTSPRTDVASVVWLCYSRKYQNKYSFRRMDIATIFSITDVSIRKALKRFEEVGL